tara:strand:+ start:647 stop:1045 length:399 start_codon:yes stop_codon:yes gene_type:complete
MTGGLQEQVTPLRKVTEKSMLQRNLKSPQVTEYAHGIGLEPASKAIIGSQEVPFIYEDRLSGDSVVEALLKMYEYGKEKRAELGAAGRAHVEKSYNFKNYAKKWEKIMMDTHKQFGSWETRKGYKSWEMIKV